MNSQERHKLHPRSLAFSTGNEVEYKTAKYTLWKITREAKQQHKQKLEGYYSCADARRMWQGQQQIRDYKGTTMEMTNTTISLPQQLYKFYSCFKTSNGETEEVLPEHTRTPTGCLIS